MAFPSTQLLMALALAVTGSARAAAPLTPDQLRSAKATTNRPDGDRFVGRRGELNGLIDAFVADSSLAGPVHLYLAARTALELGRVEDAGSLFYAAQLRRRFELERRGLGTGGSEAEQYLAFLDQTIGGLVNPAVMRNPSAFTAAIARIERWGVAPALRASLEEFERTPVTVPPERQSSLEAELKKSFLDQFGYRYAALLNDTEYFAAFKTVQDANLGKARASGKARKAYLAAQRRMAEIEAALFPPRPATPKRLYEVREGVVWCAGCPNPRLVPGADPATIEEVGGGYGRDARRVYFGTEVVEGADPVTFQSIDARAGRDVSAVYVGKRRCSACDRDTFHPVGRSWFLDRVAAYYDSLGRLERVGGVDATSFQVLNDTWPRTEPACTSEDA